MAQSGSPVQEDLAGGPAVAPFYQRPRQGREAPSEAREPLTGVLTSGAMAGPQVRAGHRKRTGAMKLSLTVFAARRRRFM